MKLELEFIGRRRIPWPGLAFLAISVIFSGTQLIAWMELNKSYQGNQQRIMSLKAAVQEKENRSARNRASADPAAERRFSEQQKIVASLNYPWNRSLSALEHTDSNEVAILEFFHGQAGKETRISVEALDTGALIGFVEKLNEDSDDPQWYMASVQPQPQNMPPTVKGIILNR